MGILGVLDALFFLRVLGIGGAAVGRLIVFHGIHALIILFHLFHLPCDNSLRGGEGFIHHFFRKDGFHVWTFQMEQY